MLRILEVTTTTLVPKGLVAETTLMAALAPLQLWVDSAICTMSSLTCHKPLQQVFITWLLQGGGLFCDYSLTHSQAVPKDHKTRESKTEDPNWKQTLEPEYQKLDI